MKLSGRLCLSISIFILMFTSSCESTDYSSQKLKGETLVPLSPNYRAILYEQDSADLTIDIQRVSKQGRVSTISKLNASASVLQGTAQWHRRGRHENLASKCWSETECSLFIQYDLSSNDGRIIIVEWLIASLEQNPTLKKVREFNVPIVRPLTSKLTIGKDNILSLSIPGTKGNPRDASIIRYNVSPYSTQTKPIAIVRKR